MRQVLKPRGPLEGAFSSKARNIFSVEIEHHALVPALPKTPRHIRPHAAQAYHSDFHLC